MYSTALRTPRTRLGAFGFSFGSMEEENSRNPYSQVPCKAHQLTRAQIHDFRETFNLFDKDGDGTVTTRELGIVMRSLGQNPTDDELQDMVAMVDKDGNGSVDFDEFLHLMARKLQEVDLESGLIEAFRLFDKDGNGYLTLPELQEVVQSAGETLTEDEISSLISESDMNSDGKLNYREFVKSLTDL